MVPLDSPYYPNCSTKYGFSKTAARCKLRTGNVRMGSATTMRSKSREKAESSELAALDIAELVDQLGEAERQFKLWTPQVNPHAARKAAILKELQARHTGLAAEKQQIHLGKSYQLEVTPCQIRRPITVAVKQMAWRALRELRIDPLQCFAITLTELRDQLGKEFVAEHVAEERTGPRDYKVTALQPAAKARRAA